MQGTLFVCGTPIGNLEDMTIRQLRMLKEVDLIACEDTRHTIKLLNHYDIKKPLTSFHIHNERQKGQKLVAMLKEGKNIALVSDAGMPGICDPGADLIRLCQEEEIPVTAAPGPTAVITALVLSGINPKAYVFYGFFPKEGKERETILSRLRRETYTSVFYEAPHRLLKTLKILCETLFHNPMAACIKELTKRHESVVKMPLDRLYQHFEMNEPKGEFVIIIAGIDEEKLLLEKQEQYKELDVQDHLDHYLEMGIEKKEAIKLVAKDRGVPKREIYACFLNED